MTHGPRYRTTLLGCALAIIAAFPALSQEGETTVIVDDRTPGAELFAERLGELGIGDRMGTGGSDQTTEMLCEVASSGQAVAVIAPEPLDRDALRECGVPGVDEITRVDLARSEAPLRAEFEDAAGTVIELIPGEGGWREGEGLASVAGTPFDVRSDTLFDERFQFPNICMMCGCCAGPLAQ